MTIEMKTASTLNIKVGRTQLPNHSKDVSEIVKTTMQEVDFVYADIYKRGSKVTLFIDKTAVLIVHTSDKRTTAPRYRLSCQVTSNSYSELTRGELEEYVKTCVSYSMSEK